MHYLEEARYYVETWVDKRYGFDKKRWMYSELFVEVLDIEEEKRKCGQ